MKLKPNNRLAYILIVVFIFLLYANSITNGYSLDDHLINKKNELTQHGLKGISDIFKNYSFNDREQSFTYRPVLLTSFAIEYYFFGVHAHTSHFISVLLYAGFVVMLFYLFNLLFPTVNYGVKLITVLLFAANPLHTEVVDNIKSRDELLVAVFGIAMLIHFQKYLSDKKLHRLLIIFILVIAGMLSKQTMLLYIALVPFVFLNYFLKAGDKKWLPLGGLIPLVIADRFAMYGIKHKFLADPAAGRNLLFYENPLINTSYAERIAAGLSIIAYNFKIMLWPFDPLYYYGFNQVPIMGWTNLLPYIGLVIILLLIFVSIKYFRSDFFLSFGAIVLLLSLLFISNIIKLLPGVVADRFLFLATLGFSMLLVSLLFKLFGKQKWMNVSSLFTELKPKASLIVAFLLFAFGLKVFSRNKIWKDEFTLISTDVVRLSESAKANDMYTYQLMGKIKVEQNFYKRNAMIDEAIAHCSKSISIYPKYITCWNNLGTLYFAKRQYAIAGAVFKKALLIDSTDANPLFNLGNVYATQNLEGPALFFYEKAMEKDPGLKDLMPMYKQFIIQNNKTDLGISFIDKLILKYPKNYELNLLMVDFYNTKNDQQGMLLYLQRAESLKHDEQIVAYIKNITTFISAKK